MKELRKCLDAIISTLKERGDLNAKSYTKRKKEN